MGAKPLCQCFQDDILDVVSKYCGQGITVCEAIGVLEMVKIDMNTVANEGDGEEDEPWKGL